jgi:hypothetical protein
LVVESIDRDQEGWAVIGCGSKFARASLLSSGLLPVHSQVEMLCRVCEAKIEAEKDRQVGRDSAAGVSNRPTSKVAPTTEAFIPIPAVQAIRNAHAQRKDRPYIQNELLTALSDCIDSNTTTERMHEAVWRAEQMIIAENQKRRGR